MSVGASMLMVDLYPGASSSSIEIVLDLQKDSSRAASARVRAIIMGEISISGDEKGKWRCDKMGDTVGASTVMFCSYSSRFGVNGQ